MMNEYYKAGHERLREIVSLHHYAITAMLRLILEKEEADSGFWIRLKRELEEGMKNGK